MLIRHSRRSDRRIGRKAWQSAHTGATQCGEMQSAPAPLLLQLLRYKVLVILLWLVLKREHLYNNISLQGLDIEAVFVIVTAFDITTI